MKESRDIDASRDRKPDPIGGSGSNTDEESEVLRNPGLRESESSRLGTIEKIQHAPEDNYSECPPYAQHAASTEYINSRWIGWDDCCGDDDDKDERREEAGEYASDLHPTHQIVRPIFVRLA